MKKVVFAALAGICVLSSFIGASGNSVKINGNAGTRQVIRDTVPNKKTDTSSNPKRDTTSHLDLNQH